MDGEGRRAGPDAALVVARGTGVRLSARARPHEIAGAIMRVLGEARFRQAAKRLSSQISREDGALNASVELERLADRTSAGPAVTP